VRVILDTDLARVYRVSIKAFNQGVKRNLARFPMNFMFRQTREEVDQVSRSQIVTGYDVQLLVAAQLSGYPLWSLDARLAAAATKLRIAYQAR
jgi:predicted nucleic acid-binding protein